MVQRLTAPGYLAGALIVLCLALGAWLYRRIARWWLRLTLLRRWRRARAGEDRARGWLETAGFTVLDAQVARIGTLLIDGVPTPFTVRADYLVERDGVLGVVEVKTGDVASPTSRATRRQVLEYAWIYGVREVYLFNADTQVLHRIEIDRRS